MAASDWIIQREPVRPELTRFSITPR